MVYFEAVRFPQKLGASELVQWMQENVGLVGIEPTQVYSEYQMLLSVDPQTKSRGRGEQAALEVLPAEAHPITTADLLDALERARRIQSADAVLDRAVEKGRPKHVVLRHADRAVRDSLQQQIAPDERPG